MEITLRGTVKNGEFHYHNKEQVAPFLNNLDGKELIAVVSEYKPTRSAKQNSYYYGVVLPIIIDYLKETQGETYTKQDVHDYHLHHILRPEVGHKVVLGETILAYDIPSTSKMSTVEFNTFKDKIQEFWAERFLIIPDPEQIEWL